MTGNRIAHPLLLSLANIHSQVRNKASHQAFTLIALLPCPKFLTKQDNLRGILENRTIHHCLDIVCEPLKIAARIGAMMSDPIGNLRFCFTPLVSYIADTPEAAMLAGVAGKTSHLTMASESSFGNSVQNEPRTASTTLAQLAAIASLVCPWDLAEYRKVAKTFRLNGVHELFWRDWFLAQSNNIANPYRFLTPEILHHHHKQFWDHDCKWCIRLVSAAEIDFRFTLLQPIVGFRYFASGISQLRQVTGRDHRNVERYIVAIIADAAPKDCVIAIQSLMVFRYYAQIPVLDDTMLVRAVTALKTFHDHKAALLDAGARVGKRNRHMDHFNVPKLEFMHSLVPSIKWTGAAIQWSADVTEHAHITEIKNPSDSTNNQNYDQQICRYLDRKEKRRDFDLATSICEKGVDIASHTNEVTEEDARTEDQVPAWIEELETNEELTGPSRRLPDFFTDAQLLLVMPPSDIIFPLRTFALPSVAFRLNRRPDINRIGIDDLANKFKIPDLRRALQDYVRSAQPSLIAGMGHRVGGVRRAASDVQLPFDDLSVWYSVRVQRRCSDGTVGLTYPQKMLAVPPSDTSGWKHGRYDVAIISYKFDDHDVTPSLGLQGIYFLVCSAR